MGFHENHNVHLFNSSAFTIKHHEWTFHKVKESRALTNTISVFVQVKDLMKEISLEMLKCTLWWCALLNLGIEMFTSAFERTQNHFSMFSLSV